MQDWAHGYNLSMGYTYGCYRDLSPEWLDAVARLAAVHPPLRSKDGQRFRYLELGSGQGLGLCILAAAYPDADFVGIDFSPSHIAHSRDLATAGGLNNITFFEADFADLGAKWPAELARFDYIVLHGIYSWVSPDLRQSLKQCLDSAALPGSLVYVSYNALPGRLPSLPFQHLAGRYKNGGQSSSDAIHKAIDMIANLDAAGAAMNKALPTLSSRAKALRTESMSYLTQEYLNDHWNAFWFSKVAGDMNDARLEFVSTTTLPELLLPGLLPKEIRQLIEGHSDLALRQELIDCAINQTFRRDLYVRGLRQQFHFTADMLDIQVYLRDPPACTSLPIKTSFSEMIVSNEVFAPIIDVLTSRPTTIADLLAQHPQGRAAMQAVLLLIHNGTLMFGRKGLASDSAAGKRMNCALAKRAQAGAPYRHLCAPMLGSGISVSDIDMMLLAAYVDGPELDDIELAQQTLSTIRALNLRPMDEANVPLAAEALQVEASKAVKLFRNTTLPAWRELGMV